MAPFKAYIILLLLQNSALYTDQQSFYLSGSAISDNYFSFQFMDASAISISGKSNVNEFVCLAYQNLSPGNGTLHLNESTHHLQFEHTSINIPVKSLRCDNSVMDYDMYQALKSEKYPYITLTLKDAYSPANQKLDLSHPITITALVDIKIAGVTKSQSIKVIAHKNATGQFSFKGSHTINLSHFQIEAPTALFGVIKVKDEVKINFDLQVSAW